MEKTEMENSSESFQNDVAKGRGDGKKSTSYSQASFWFVFSEARRSVAKKRGGLKGKWMKGKKFFTRRTREAARESKRSVHGSSIVNSAQKRNAGLAW